MKYRWNEPCTVLIQGVLYESEEQDKSKVFQAFQSHLPHYPRSSLCILV